MRFNPYDDVTVQSVAASSVAIQSLTGSSAVNQDGYDTSVGLESLMVHIRTEIASGTPTTATVAWKLQESNDNGSADAYADAKDNSGTVIGATITTKTVANDVFARIEGIMLNNQASTTPFGGRKKWLRLVFTPTYTGGSSPATLIYADFLGTQGSVIRPVRTAVSNT